MVDDEDFWVQCKTCGSGGGGNGDQVDLWVSLHLRLCGPVEVTAVPKSEQRQ